MVPPAGGCLYAHNLTGILGGGTAPDAPWGGLGRCVQPLPPLAALHVFFYISILSN